MIRRLTVLLLALAMAWTGAADELPCGTPVLEIDAIDKWFSWGYAAAPGPDGNFLSLDRGRILLLDPTGVLLRQEQLVPYDLFRTGAVSADETGYLVFWTEPSFSPSSNLHLARLSADGHLQSTSTIDIGHGSRAIELDAASDGVHHLLVWTGTDGYLHRFLLNTSGTVVDRAHEIAETQPCSDLTVAAGASGFAVTASAQRQCEAPARTDRDPRLQVLFLDSAGDVRTTTVLEQSAGGSVAAWKGQWVVVWASDDGIQGRLFDPQGTPASVPSLIIDEPTSMYPDLGSNGSELFLLWYSDVVPDNACGIRWDVAVSRIDAEMRETEREVLDSIFESHCPPSGYTGPFQPRGDVACTADECLMTHGRFAAIADEEGLSVLGGSRGYRPETAILSVDRIADGHYLATLLVEDSLEVVRVDHEGTVVARRTLAQLGPGFSSPATTTTTDGRFALITARDRTPFYGWIVDTSSLEVIRERFPVPEGTWAGGPDSFLVAWLHKIDSQQSLQLAIFGIDGEVRLSTGVMEARSISAAPGWLVDRFVVVGTSTETAGIFEISPAGGPVVSYPLPWKPYRITSSGEADGKLLVVGSMISGRSDDVLVVERGGEWKPETLPRNSQSGTEAMVWNGRLWMSLSWSNSVFGEVGGDDLLELKGRLIAAEEGAITTYSVTREGSVLKLLLHRIAADEPFASVSFASTWRQLHEWQTEAAITLLRTGSIGATAEVRVTILGADSHPLPFEIPDPVVRFHPGEISKELRLVVPNDSVYQDLRTVLKIEPANSETVVECHDEVTIRIADDDEPVLIPQTLEIAEGDEPRTETLRFTLLGGFLRPTLIDVYAEPYPYHPAPAEPGQDFDHLNRSILVEPGQQTVEIPITILGDRRHEPDELIHLRYWYGRDMRTVDRIIISIIDDDEPRRRTIRRP